MDYATHNGFLKYNNKFCIIFRQNAWNENLQLKVKRIHITEM